MKTADNFMLPPKRNRMELLPEMFDFLGEFELVGFGY